MLSVFGDFSAMRWLIYQTHLTKAWVLHSVRFYVCRIPLFTFVSESVSHFTLLDQHPLLRIWKMMDPLVWNPIEISLVMYPICPHPAFFFFHFPFSFLRYRSDINASLFLLLLSFLVLSLSAVDESLPLKHFLRKEEFNSLAEIRFVFFFFFRLLLLCRVFVFTARSFLELFTIFRVRSEIFITFSFFAG